MASMRDAIARLSIIYESCAPEAIALAAAEMGLDEFSRLKKKINREVKDCRKGLKEREALIKRRGTNAETAEASYHLRVMVKALKVDSERMEELVRAEEKKKKGKKGRLDDEEIKLRREVVELCKQHITEVEDLEQRRFAEKLGADRGELLKGSDSEGGSPKSKKSEKRRPYGQEGEMEEKNSNRKALFDGKKKGKKSKKKDEYDPFKSELPDIEVEQDFQEMNINNQAIDSDLEDIGKGVSKLREVATEMGKELDQQNDQIRDLEKGIDNVLDQVDSINIRLKQTVDKVMSGDRFMVNCILICVILGLVVFISAMFR